MRISQGEINVIREALMEDGPIPCPVRGCEVIINTQDEWVDHHESVHPESLADEIP